MRCDETKSFRVVDEEDQLKADDDHDKSYAHDEISKDVEDNNFNLHEHEAHRRTEDRDNIISPSSAYNFPPSYIEATDSYSITASPNLSLLRSARTIFSRQPINEHFLEDSKVPLLDERSNSIPSGITEPSGSCMHEGSFVTPHKGNCSLSQTVFNGFNVFVGIGLLSLPSTIQEGGWICAIFLLLYAGLCYYTGSLLRICMELEDNITIFSDLGQAAFGNYGRLLFFIVFYIEQYFGCVEFIILEADNLAKLFPNASLTLAGLYLSPVHLLGIAVALIVLPFCYMRDYKNISYLSALGVIGAFFLVLSLILVGTMEDIGFNQTGPIIKWSGLPYSFGVFGFSYSGHSVLPNLYNAMADKRLFKKALIWIFILSTSVYFAVGVLGFLLFGEDTDSPITLNLPDDAIASKIALWVMVVIPLLKYPMLLNPLASCIEELMPSGLSNNYGCIIPFRTGLVVASVCIAFLVPYFGLVMSLAGSLLCMLASIILPSICYLRIKAKRIDPTRLEVVTCYAVSALGVVFTVCGTYSAIYDIIQSY